jgi:hypothetical protein
MAIYDATAARAHDGWVVVVEGVGVIRADRFDDAAPLAADMVAARLAVDPATVQVVLHPELPKQIVDAIENRHAAAARREEDPQWYAEADLYARRLLRKYGISDRDADAVLDASGRRAE